jgi:hypothetical protein
MASTERPVDQNVPQEERQERAVSRRRLLKALAAAGGAATASTMLPGKWSEPIVEMGVLPVHAQITPVPDETATPTPTSTPTPTPTPTLTPEPAAIIGCFAFNAATGQGIIGPTDTIGTYAVIAPTRSDIQLSRTITLNQAGHPQDGVVDAVTGTTDAAGRFQPPDFDLSTLSPTISPGDDRLTILWEFVNPADGTNTCQNNVDIVEQH